MPKNNVYNTRKLVEAAVLSAISVIIMFLNINMPLFNMVGLFILPIPSALLYTRHGRKYSVMSVLVSSVLIIFMTNPIIGISMGLLYGSIGIVLGYCISNKKKFPTMIVMLFIMCIIVNTVFLFINVKLVQKDSIRNVIKQQTVMTRESYQMAKSINGSNKLTKEQQATMKDVEDKMFNVDTMLKILPVVIVFISFVSAILNYFISTFIMRKLGTDILPRKPFSEFYFEGNTGILLLVLIVTGLVLHYTKIPAGDYVLNALIVITLIIFLVEGMAVAIYFMRNKWHFSKFGTVILNIIILTSPLIFIFLYLGLTDLLIDFRKIFKYRKEQ